VPPEDPDRQAAARWFMRELGVGENAAGRMAAFYVLLCRADPTQSAERAASQNEATRQRRSAPRPATASAPARALSSGGTQPTPPAPAAPAREPIPSLHIDVQVHIPSDASAEQIDAIFSSMAKHLYKRS
jgi:hypothetical protein